MGRMRGMKRIDKKTPFRDHFPRFMMSETHPEKMSSPLKEKWLGVRLLISIVMTVSGMALILVFTFLGYRNGLFFTPKDKAQILKDQREWLTMYERLGTIHRRIDRLYVKERRISEIIGIQVPTGKKVIRAEGGVDSWKAPAIFEKYGEKYMPRLESQIERALKDEHASLLDRESHLDRIIGMIKKQKRKWQLIPSMRPALGPISSGFGWRESPFKSGAEFHAGIDIAGKSGAPIMAPAGGVVILSGWDGGFGKTVKIRHTDGIVTLFGHLSNIYVHEGEHVVRGQVLATIGSTGLSTGPHLHYEVFLNHTPVNPRMYFLIDPPRAPSYPKG